MFPSPFRVSFLLIRIKIYNFEYEILEFPSPFRVSFLLIVNVTKNEVKNITSFRLLSECLFFLCFLSISVYPAYLRFPSPFRVSFLLILPQQTPYFIIYCFIIFVRILKIFIFLFLNNKKYTLTPIFKVSWRLLKKIIIFVFNFI